jgi:hypothetical protein
VWEWVRNASNVGENLKIHVLRIEFRVIWKKRMRRWMKKNILRNSGSSYSNIVAPWKFFFLLTDTKRISARLFQFSKLDFIDHQIAILWNAKHKSIFSSPSQLTWLVNQISSFLVENVKMLKLKIFLVLMENSFLWHIRLIEGIFLLVHSFLFFFFHFISDVLIVVANSTLPLSMFFFHISHWFLFSSHGKFFFYLLTNRWAIEKNRFRFSLLCIFALHIPFLLLIFLFIWNLIQLRKYNSTQHPKKSYKERKWKKRNRRNWQFLKIIALLMLMPCGYRTQLIWWNRNV